MTPAYWPIRKFIIKLVVVTIIIKPVALTNSSLALKIQK